MLVLTGSTKGSNEIGQQQSSESTSIDDDAVGVSGATAAAPAPLVASAPRAEPSWARRSSNSAWRILAASASRRFLCSSAASFAASSAASRRACHDDIAGVKERAKKSEAMRGSHRANLDTPVARAPLHARARRSPPRASASRAQSWPHASPPRGAPPPLLPPSSRHHHPRSTTPTW